MSSSASNGKKEEERNPFYIPDVGRVDPMSIGSIYGMPAKNKNKEPDYIPYNARGRDVTGRLFFNSGAFWLGGFTAGSVYGFQEGWRGAASPIARIRFNSVMNAISRRGSYLGNSLGVVAFYHTSWVWLADQFELESVTGSKLATPVFAGFMTGGLYKCTTTPKGAILSAAIGAAGSCVYWFGGSYVYNVLLGRGGRY